MKKKPIPSAEKEEIANRQFDPSVTDRERAIFEGGITLGALYHQFAGVPVIRNRKILLLLERTISQTMKLQPYKERVKVRIRDSEVTGSRASPFDYSELDGKMLESEVVSRYKGCRATLAMKYIPELKYNLMYIERVEEMGGSKRGRSNPKRT